MKGTAIEIPLAKRGQLALKFYTDIVIASVVLIIASPFLAIIALAIKLTSRGSVIYKQIRVGQNGVAFNCLKFRSMRQDAERKTGPVWAQDHDDRVTPVGQFLRRWCLDELPQLWNVLRGEMSLIGPRPERPSFVAQFEQKIHNYQERHIMRPGLTGWAQVNGLRGNTSIEDRTTYDRYYVNNWSLGFDLKVFFLTFRAIIKGNNV